MIFGNKKTGFTLSEVMVTITLIGFVATMTIATVGTSIQQKARLSEFRTAYAKLQTALKDVESDDGVIYACYDKPSADDVTTYGLRIEKYIADGSDDDTEENARFKINAQSSQCNVFMGKFVRALGATRFCEDDPAGEGCIPANGTYPTFQGAAPEDNCFPTIRSAYVLDNGMILFTNGTFKTDDDASSVDSNDYLKLFAVDVNGRKGPNKWGQDVFTFAVKASRASVVNGAQKVTDVDILPPACLPGHSDDGRRGATRSTDQLLKESVNYN